MTNVELPVVFGWLEWALLILAIIGVIANTYGTREALLDRRAVIQSGANHGRQEAANRNLRRDVVLALVMAIFGTAGIVGILTPATPSQLSPVWQTWHWYVGALAIESMLIGLTIVGQWEYFNLRHRPADPAQA